MRHILVAIAGFFLASTSAHAATFELEYEASILNIVTLGTMQISGNTSPTAYSANASMQTSGLAQLFDDTRITTRSSGSMANGVLGWMRYDLDHAYARKSRRVSMTRTGSGVTSRITPIHQNMGTPPATPAQQAVSFDPLSALLALSTGVGRARACTGRYLVFDGRQHFALELTPASRGTYKGGGFDGPAVVCTMSYEPISGFKTMTPLERARIPRGQAWFAEAPTGGFAQLLRVAVPTPLGEGRIDLKRFTLAP